MIHLKLKTICDLCGKRFSNINQHMRVVHKVHTREVSRFVDHQPKSDPRAFSRTRISSPTLKFGGEGFGVGGIRLKSLGWVEFYTQNYLADLLKNVVLNVFIITIDYDLINICYTIFAT